MDIISLICISAESKAADSLNTYPILYIGDIVSTRAVLSRVRLRLSIDFGSREHRHDDEVS